MDTGTALNFLNNQDIRRREATAREEATQRRDSLRKVDMGREKPTPGVGEVTVEATEVEEGVEIGTTIKEGTMAMVDTAGEIIGVEEVDTRTRVVVERGGTTVDTTAAAAGTNGEAQQVVIDHRRESIMMMATKMEEEVTTEDQGMREAMRGRRVSLAPRRIMSETLKMHKVRHVV